MYAGAVYVRVSMCDETGHVARDVRCLCVSEMQVHSILCDFHLHIFRGGDPQLILDGTSVVSASQDACDDHFDFGLERHGLNVSLHRNRLRLDLSDGQSNATLLTDDFCSEKLLDGGLHHAAFIVDGAAGIVTAVVDGVLCDGGVGEGPGLGVAAQ